MMVVDLHTHTHRSHGRDDESAMLQAALDAGVRVFGYTEHVPRPAEYAYPNDYSERLATNFPEHMAAVRDLQKRHADDITVLAGAEFDYFPGYEEHIAAFIEQWNFDYILGSVHFLDHWGFDFTARDWRDVDEEALFGDYVEYFSLMRRMAATGMFDVAAHLDLIKIFSVDAFHVWLTTDTATRCLEDVLSAMRDKNMILEISSAGLRKPCREIYPCPAAMRMARAMDLPICFASDAHKTSDVAHAWSELADYARSFGYHEHCYPKNGERIFLPL